MNLIRCKKELLILGLAPGARGTIFGDGELRGGKLRGRGRGELRGEGNGDGDGDPEISGNLPFWKKFFFHLSKNFFIFKIFLNV
jgi:hypothetical protein